MVIELNKENFEKALQEHSILIVDFYAVWCGPCIAIKPIFEKISEYYSGKVFFGQVNVDTLRDIAIKFKISSIPTFICFKNGQIHWVHTGTLTEHMFKEKIDSSL